MSSCVSGFLEIGIFDKKIYDNSSVTSCFGSILNTVYMPIASVQTPAVSITHSTVSRLPHFCQKPEAFPQFLTFHIPFHHNISAWVTPTWRATSIKPFENGPLQMRICTFWSCNRHTTPPTGDTMDLWWKQVRQRSRQYYGRIMKTLGQSQKMCTPNSRLILNKNRSNLYLTCALITGIK